MYNNKTTADWVEGFAKESADMGLSPEEAQDLMVATQRLSLIDKQSDAYTEAYNEVMAEAGIEKNAQGFWEHVGLGAAGGAAGLGAIGGIPGAGIGTVLGGLTGAGTYLFRGGGRGNELRKRVGTERRARKFQDRQWEDFDYRQRLKNIRQSSPYTQQRLEKERLAKTNARSKGLGRSSPYGYPYTPRRYYQPRGYGYY